MAKQIWSLIADLHTGSPVGLNPTPTNEVQSGLLDRYTDAIIWFGEPPDVVVVVGDISEGVDPKLDIEDPVLANQFRKSAELICMWNAKSEYIIITGTKVHTHIQHQELESLMAPLIRDISFDLYGFRPRVSVRRKLNTTINEWFHLSARHFINTSIIFHGRTTPVVRAQMWSILNSALKSFQEEAPLHWPDLLVFGHAHYYDFHKNAWGATLVLPGWKALGDKYGEEICTGSINLGATKLEIGDTKEEGWTEETKLYYAGVVSRLENR